MNATRLSVVLLCWAIAAAPVRAQSGDQPAPTPTKAEPILDQMPADALAYLVVNNIRDATDRADVFLQQINATKLIFGIEAVSLLEFIQMATQLGESLNPDAGIGVAMLDPQRFGIDLAKALSPDPGTPAAERPQLPLVTFIPADDVEQLFASYEMKPAGKYTRVQLRMGPVFAGKCGSYVVLSASEKYLDAVLGADRKAGAGMPKDHAAALARADIGLHVDMKLAGPIALKSLAAFEAQTRSRPKVSAAPTGIKAKLARWAQAMLPAAPVWRQVIPQLQAVSVTARFVEGGALVEKVVSFRPDSTLGSATAACKAPAVASLYDRLPNLPYVLAAGASWQGSAEHCQVFCRGILDELLKDVPESRLSAETKAKAGRLAQEFCELVEAAQFVAGGAPEGSGVLGMACVLQCKDPAAVRNWLAEATAVAQEVLRNSPGAKPGPTTQPQSEAAVAEKAEASPLANLILLHEKDVEMIGPTPIDSITVSHPALDDASSKLHRKAKALLGEDKVRLRIATAGKNTVVVALGGSQGFLQEALKAAEGGGNIPADKQLAEAMKHMPKNMAGLVLFSGENLSSVLEKYLGSLAAEGRPTAPSFRITEKTPVVVGVGVAGNTVHGVLYAPNELIKQALEAFTKKEEKPAPPVRGADDF